MGDEPLICDGNQGKDDDSIISERCWKEEYRGHSRKWILRDGSVKKTDPPIGSSMKSSFTYPMPDDRQHIGKRKAILQKKLYEEALQEIIHERAEPPLVEEYCTEYDGNYSVPGFEPEKIPERNIELNLKYPLYASKPMSYWQFTLEKQGKDRVSLAGLSKTVDPNNPFKRYNGFTKPLSEVVDILEEL